MKDHAKTVQKRGWSLGLSVGIAVGLSAAGVAGLGWLSSDARALDRFSKKTS